MKNTTYDRQIRRYSELITLPTYDERFLYLKLDGSVGKDTFGFDRWMNQQFYKSREWLRIRDEVIARDLGRDLALYGYDIHDKILIHHMNPITPEDISAGSELLLNPEFLITVCTNTHNAIHYGGLETLNNRIIERVPNDTCPWR